MGLRQGEALALRWDDYKRDGTDRYLEVLEAVQRIDGKLVRTDVKSRASHRRVPVPVITSYSIHYTKLYEIRPPMAFWWLALVPFM